MYKYMHAYKKIKLTFTGFKKPKVSYMNKLSLKFFVKTKDKFIILLILLKHI